MMRGRLKKKETLEKVIEITFAVDNSFNNFELLRITLILRDILKKAKIYEEEAESLGHERYIAVFGKYKFSIIFYRGIKEENGKYLHLGKVKRKIKKKGNEVIEREEKYYTPIVLQTNFIYLYKEGGVVKIDLNKGKESYTLGSEADLRVTVEALPVAIKGILYKLSGENNNLLNKIVISEQEKNAILGFLKKKRYFKVF